MVLQKRPGIALCMAFFKYYSEAIKKSLTVLIVTENCRPFNPSGHNVLQKPRGIKSCLSRHCFLMRGAADTLIQQHNPVSEKACCNALSKEHMFLFLRIQLHGSEEFKKYLHSTTIIFKIAPPP